MRWFGEKSVATKTQENGSPAFLRRSPSPAVEGDGCRPRVLRPGFSFTEAIVSVSILAILATTSVFSLRASQQSEELNNAARVLAADLRSAQSRALSAQNVRTCQPSPGSYRLCEADASACLGQACQAAPPAGYGIRLDRDQTSYRLFAVFAPTTAGWLDADPAAQDVLVRDLAGNGASNVQVAGFDSTPSSGARVDVAFQRQNGVMRLNGTPSGVPAEPPSVRITLRHAVSGKTKVVVANAVTGRVSIE